MRKILKTIAGSIWLVVVVYYYYKHHAYYQTDLPGLLHFWPLWSLPLLAYAGFLFWNWIAENKKVRSRVNLAKILAIFFLSMLFVGNVTFSVVKPVFYAGPEAILDQQGKTVMNPTREQVKNASYHFEYGTSISDTHYNFYKNVDPQIKEHLRKANFMDIQMGLAWTFIKIYGASLVLFFFALVLGRTLHNAIRKGRSSDDAATMEGHLIDMVLGLGLTSTLFYFVAWAGLFKLVLLLPLMGTLLVLLYKQTWAALKSLWAWHMDLELSIYDLSIPIFGFLVLFAEIHMFDNLSPLPRGWDGLNRYMVIPRDLVAHGALVKRGGMYGWELILGLAYMLNIKLTLAWTSIPGILTFVVMWMLARRMGSRTGTALALATIISMPMMSFHLSDENKVDVVHWLMGSVSLLAFLKALEFKEGKTHIKDKSYLLIAALIAGYAFTVKFTAVFLILALLSVFAFIEGGWIALLAAFLASIGVMSTQGGLGLGTEFLTQDNTNQWILLGGILGSAIVTGFGFLKKRIQWSSLKTLIILGIMVALPILPWLGKNIIDLKTLAPSEIFYGANDVPVVDLELNLALCHPTAFYEEYDRYVGYNHNLLLRILALPWHQTMNDTGAMGAYVDIGFAFLGFMLLALFFNKVTKENRVILLFGILYTVFWMLKASGVIWYGFPLFSLMAMLLAATFTKMNKEGLGRLVLVVILGIWFVSALDSRLSNFAKSSLLLNLTNSVTADDVRESIFPYSNELHDFLAENEGYVYKIGTPLMYFYPDSYERSFDDQLLDAFSCIYENQNENFDAVRHLLRKVGFRYMLYDSFTSTVGLDPEGTLQKKVDLFVKFANEQLMLVIYDDKRGHHLFYLPSDEELANFKSQQTPATNE